MLFLAKPQTEWDKREMEKEKEYKLNIKHFSELTVPELYEILKVRVNVFVVEQNCPYSELDDKDLNAYHLWLSDEKDEIKAYLRVLDKGVSFSEAAIGRVLSLERRKGLASRLMKAGIKTAYEKFEADEIKLEAQVYAKALYEKLGFEVTSDEFLEDGIPHVEMLLKNVGERYGKI